MKISSRRIVFVVVCTLFSVWAGMVHAQSWQHRQAEILFESERIRTALMNVFPNEDRSSIESRINWLLAENLPFKSAVRIYQGELEAQRILTQSEMSGEMSYEDARKLEAISKLKFAKNAFKIGIW